MGDTMLHPVAATSARLAAAALCLVLASGCASGKKQAAAQDDRATTTRNAADYAFERGANKPPKARTMFSLAKILAVQGRDAEAITVLHSLIQRHPDFIPAYNALAEAHLRADRPSDAVAALKAGLVRKPDDAALLNNLGMVYFLNEKYDAALEQFDRAVAARPKEATYAMNKAMALGMLGQVREAEAMYSQFLSYSDTRHNLRVLAKARAEARRRDEAEAEAAVTEPPATDPLAARVEESQP